MRHETLERLEYLVFSEDFMLVFGELGDTRNYYARLEKNGFIMLHGYGDGMADAADNLVERLERFNIGAWLEATAERIRGDKL